MASIEMKILKNKTVFKITVFLGYENGSAVRKSETYTPKEKSPQKIKKEVEKYAFELETRLKKEYEESKKGTKFSAFYKKWLDTYAKINMTSRTFENAERTINKYFMGKFGNMSLSEIKTLHIQEIIDSMSMNGMNHQTVKKYFNLFKQIMTYAQKMELIEKNPCNNCILPKNKDTSKEVVDYYTPEEMKKILNEVLYGKYKVFYSERKRTGKNGKEYTVAAYEVEKEIEFIWKTFFTVSAYTGLRPAEILALRWEDIDFENCDINIKHALSRSKKEGTYMKGPKTKAGNRSVRVPDYVMGMIRQLYEEQKEHIRNCSSSWKGKSREKEFGENLVFPRKNGLPMSVSTPTHKFGEILKMYNASVNENDRIPELKLYSFRHSYATSLISRGLNIEAVSAAMGHSDVAVTLNIYAKALQKDINEAPKYLQEIYS